ncbi:DUF4230 domain-containing protein [uncultured Acetatifactor sp.]|uniref:DUF4230 domain-containing protein n=1 Tax=uncultured Acetatifactor sp. TaxID=1671927 RepID=UPI002626C059|nr:DUF4230 domain-containing protein [uncultured Acetatifactor sp.]
MKGTQKNGEKAVLAEKADLAILMKQKNQNKQLLVMIIVAFLIVIVLFGMIAWNIGGTLGALAGTANGSYDGITEGLGKGYEAGREEGLSAKDTKVDIVSEIKAIGKLEVLMVESEIVDYFTVGDDFKGLFLHKGIATFSVDFSEIDIRSEDSIITIVLPNPEVEFRIDENESEKIAEWQKHSWSNNTEAGYTAYMNSMEQIKEKSAAEMEDYEDWERMARESAKKQVEILASSVSGEDIEVQINFREEP